MRATLSVAGLYQYDNTIFDNFALPLNVSKEVVVDNILYETQELEVAIPDPDKLKWAIGRWSAKMLPIWTKLQATLNFTYNPIENYNRTDTETTGRAVHSTDVTSGGDTVNEYTAGFNSADAQANVPARRNTSTLGSTTTTDGTDNASRSLISTGNIGVTTTQEMIKQEREIDEFSLIDHIIIDFKTQFCILVY